MTRDAGYAALVGIDWADTKHDCCLRVMGADREEYGVMEHLPEAIDHWARALAARFPGRKMAVCLEQSKGSLIYALLEYDCFVLYPMNPRMWQEVSRPYAFNPRPDPRPTRRDPGG